MISSEERFWPSRVRWRLRGAWQWPAFAGLTLVDGLILHLLPPVRTGVDPIPALLIATFGNLVLVGAVAPWIARRLARRAGDQRRLPSTASGSLAAAPEVALEVMRDRTAAVMLAAGALGLVAAGLAARPLVVVETEAREQATAALTDYIAREADAEVIRNVQTANTIRLGEDYFRTCIARDDRRRHFCVFIDTSREPATVTKDPSTVRNEELVPR